MSRGMGIMGIALALAVTALAMAHVALAAGLARRRAYGRALLALVVPPLAPFWGWQAGLRRTSLVWLAALAVYTLVLVSGALWLAPR